MDVEEGIRGSWNLILLGIQFESFDESKLQSNDPFIRTYHVKRKLLTV